MRGRTACREERRVGTQGRHEVRGPLDDPRVCRGDVPGFADVGFHVVEFDRLAGVVSYRFPIPHTHRLSEALLVEFPIKRRMSYLAFPEPCLENGDPVNAFWSMLSSQLAERRKHVPEGQNLV